MPKWLTQELKDAQEDVEFENYVTLLKEARAQFGREMECAVILYITQTQRITLLPGLHGPS